MADPKIEEIQTWLEKAGQDLEAAAWLLQSPSALYGAVGFHCQQAVEKALKAYLTWVEQPFEKIHSLVALVGMCLEHDEGFSQLRTIASTLTPYAVTTRYPGDLAEITETEAMQALELAQEAWQFILNHLPEDAMRNEYPPRPLRIFLCPGKD